MIIGDHKKVATMIVAKLKPEGEMDEMHPELEQDMEEHEKDYEEGLKAAARDALDAIKADDEHAFAMALHSFFEMCDEMPHEEGPHIEEEGMEEEMPEHHE